MKMHWETLYACDFFSVEVLGILGTVGYMVFFVMEVETRAVEIAGIQVDPGGEWMKQIARNLTDPVHGFLRGAKFLIHDRDPLFTKAFVAILRTCGVASVETPAKSPNCNPHAERFVKTIRDECLNHFVFFGGASSASCDLGIRGALLGGTLSPGHRWSTRQDPGWGRERQWNSRPDRLPLETRHPLELLPPRGSVNGRDGFRDTTGSRMGRRTRGDSRWRRRAPL